MLAYFFPSHHNKVLCFQIFVVGTCILHPMLPNSTGNSKKNFTFRYDRNNNKKKKNFFVFLGISLPGKRPENLKFEEKIIMSTGKSHEENSESDSSDFDFSDSDESDVCLSSIERNFSEILNSRICVQKFKKYNVIMK